MKRLTGARLPVLLLLLSQAALSGCDRGEPAPESEPAAQTEPVRFPAGLEVETLQEGSGTAVGRGRMVSVHYTGWLEDGTQFDSSRERGTPLTFTVGTEQVIRGLEAGMMGMREGEIRRITIPPELGYGQQRSGQIPPGATLLFEVELLEAR